MLIVLSHDMLDRELWQPAVRLGIRHPLHGGPQLIFPWTSRDHIPWTEVGGSFVTINSGDTLCVDQVWAQSTASAFGSDDHSHNREMMIAKLSILRADKSEEFGGLLAFHAVQSTIRPGAPGDENERIGEALFLRLTERCGFDPKDYIGLEPEEWPAIPAHLSMSERHALLSLLDHDGEPTVGFGYWMARAEAEAGVGLSAGEFRRRREKRQADAALLAAENARSADRRWRDVMLPIAQAFRAKIPDISQRDLADALFRVPEAPNEMPAHDTVVDTIVVWEQTEKLVRSTKNPNFRGG